MRLMIRLAVVAGTRASATRSLPWIAGVLLLTAACSSDASGPPSDPSDSAADRCDGDPDSPTALGVTGRDLWDAFSGEHMLELTRGRNAFEELTFGPAESFTITIEPSSESIPEARDCDRVAAAIRVKVISPEAGIENRFRGVVYGTPLEAIVQFGSTLGTSPHVDGLIQFKPDIVSVDISTHMRKSDTSWTYSKARMQP